jgi:hypothetical protein
MGSFGGAPQGSVLIVMPDGRGDIYQPNGNGGYISPSGVASTLVKTGDYVSADTSRWLRLCVRRAAVDEW